MNKIIRKLLKFCFIISLLFAICIVSSQYKIVAGVTIPSSRILNQAISYNDWNYENINSTYVVTRTLNDLGIAKHIAGESNDKNEPYTPEEMYKNAQQYPDEANMVWEGYVSDLSFNEHNFNNGDLLIQRSMDQDTHNGAVGFIHLSERAIAFYGLNSEKSNVEDTILVDEKNEVANEANTYVTIFRLSTIQPELSSITSRKSVVVNLTIKPVNIAEQSFDNLISKANQQEYQYLYTGDSKQIFYCTNFKKLDSENQQQLLNEGVFPSEQDAIVYADEQAQQHVLETVKQNHLLINSNANAEEKLQSNTLIVNNNAATSSHIDHTNNSKVKDSEKYMFLFHVVVICIAMIILLLIIILIIMTVKIRKNIALLVFKHNQEINYNPVNFKKEIF